MCAVAIATAIFVQAFVVKAYSIPSGSMIPTLQIGQRVLVDRVSERFAEPQVGDILVFHPPAGAEAMTAGCADPLSGVGRQKACGTPAARVEKTNFIKRVVGVAGDRISVRDGHVIRNGRQADEPFIDACTSPAPECDFREEIVVPAGTVYMMGDNRADSYDSRFWGPVAVEQVIGRARATYWPLDRIGPLR